jgi:hypothetical protein
MILPWARDEGLFSDLEPKGGIDELTAIQQGCTANAVSPPAPERQDNPAELGARKRAVPPDASPPLGYPVWRSWLVVSLLRADEVIE